MERSAPVRFKKLSRFFPWVVLACVVALIFLTDRADVRYANYTAQCKMIYGYNTSQRTIDLVSIGSSRSMRAMQADVLSEDVSRVHNIDKPVIFDLSRSYRDMGHMYAFLEDMLENNDVRMLLVEYKDNGDDWYHHNFKEVAKLNQIFELGSSRASESPVEVTHTIYKMIVERASNLITKTLTKKLKRSCVPLEQKPVEASVDPSQPWFVNSKLLVDIDDKQRDKPREAVRIDYTSDAEERSTYYAHKIVELAKSKNVEVFFYHIPALFSPQLSNDFVGEFNREFGAKLIQMPADMVDSLYPKGYTDATHMGELGSRTYMKYLAQALPW